jgi:hypothetical protein
MQAELLPVDGLYVPAGQAVQTDALAALLYVATAQAMHAADELPPVDGL